MKIIPVISAVLLMLLMSFSAYAAEQKVYMLYLNYDKGNLSVDNIYVTIAYFNEEKNQPENGYKLELISFDNSVLHAQKFNPIPFIVYEAKPEWFDEKGNQIYIPNESESSRVLDKASIELMIPYFKNGKTINIYDPNNTKVLEIDIGYFADVCGDNICEPHENSINCLQDCPAEGVSEEIGKGKGNFLIFFIGILAFFITIFTIFGIKIHKAESKSKLENYILTAIKKGLSAKQIRENLLKAGYSEKEVDAIFKKLLKKE